MIDENSSSLMLLDIMRGFSVLDINSKTYYFKHFTISDLLEVDEFTFLSYKDSMKLGVKNKEQLIADAIKTGAWSQKEEDKIKSLEWMIDKSNEALNKITDNNQRGSFLKSIEKQQEELNSINSKRTALFVYSAENLSEKKKIQKILASCLFLDKEFTKCVDEDDLPELSYHVFQKISQYSSRNAILKAIYFTHFFELFSIQHRNPLLLFNKTLCDLTVFQKNLLMYSNTLLSKIKNLQIPKEYFSDPVKIYEFKESSGEERSSNTTVGIDDIKAKMKANNGKIKAEDLLS